MKLAIVGTGYVGLVSGTCFAEMGNDVICIDIDEAKVKKLQNGEVPIFEPGLKKLLDRNIAKNRIQFSTDLQDGLDHAEVIFLALPTPPGEDGSADLKYVLGVAEQIGQKMDAYKLIVNKSTVPVGTADRVQSAISTNTTLDFDVVSNPEFLREGAAVGDFLKPDRVVIGTESERAQKIMGELYAPFVKQGNPIYYMNTRSSEMTKYASNSYLATRISFMNEIANLCDILGADVDEVRMGMGSDGRIGKQFLYAGIGYGGSCFPKDVLALCKTSQENDYNFQILNAVVDVNALQRQRFYERIKAHFKGDLKGKKIAVWGLAFKPKTDDIREAPALYLLQRFIDDGATVCAYDQEAMDNTKKVMGDKVEFATEPYGCLPDADALVMVTEWTEFRAPDFPKMKALMNAPVIFDGRNIYDKNTPAAHGFHYESVGRPIDQS